MVLVIRRSAPILLALAAAATLGAGIAGAAPVVPDADQPANGAGVTGPLVTGAGSPIQVPTPTVESAGGTTTVTAHPFLAPWVHNAIPVDPSSVVELRGAARITLPNLATGGRLVVNPNGHCVFGDGDGESVPIPSVHVDTPVFALTIEPSLRRR